MSRILTGEFVDPREVVIFGAGSAGRRLNCKLQSRQVRVHAFCDNDPCKQGTRVDEIPVIAPAALADLSEIPIVIASISRDEIVHQLTTLGYAELMLECPEVAEFRDEKMREAANALAPLESWLDSNRISLVEALRACRSDERVRNVGLAMIEILRDVFFSRGSRTWFQHDLEFFYAAEQRGVHFLPVHYYSPLPKTTDIDSAHWSTYETPGFDWKPEEQWQLLENQLVDFIPEFLAEVRHGALKQVMADAAFVEGDLALYHAMIRLFRPRRIIEVGAGVSTWVALDACHRNTSGQITCVEPYPLPLLEALGDRIQLERVKVQQLGTAYYQQLEAGDILFIDSTHVVATGSDVNHLVLQVLPTLRPGVLVHFHDIHLPREMPETWIKQEALFWNEQYLVQAFLAFNCSFEIVLSSSYLGHVDSNRYHRSAGSSAGGSLWIRRIEEAPATSAGGVQ